MVALQMPPAARYARRARRFYNIGWRDDETEIMRCWDDAAPRRLQGVQARHACVMDVWSILDWFSKDFGFTLGQSFASKEPWDELWDYFELILGSWRGIREVVGSLMLENRSQNQGNLAAHLHFESKSWSANLLKAPQSLPEGLPKRMKVVKRNNHQQIDKLYAFEGGSVVSLDDKMKIFSDKIRRWIYQL